MLTLAPSAAMCRVPHGLTAAAHVAYQSRGFCKALGTAFHSQPVLTRRRTSEAICVNKGQNYLGQDPAAKRVSLLHTSNSLDAKRGEQIEQKIIKAWRTSPIKPFWDNNHFLNRNFIERFELKLKHPIAFMLGTSALMLLPEAVFYVVVLSAMYYVIKNRKFY